MKGNSINGMIQYTYFPISSIYSHVLMKLTLKDVSNTFTYKNQFLSFFNRSKIMLKDHFVSNKNDQLIYS